jgi:DNA (cytosine-5)-methyltransferase 1
MLRVLDLFSGIGGFSLGLERTGGFRTVAFCEIDGWCRQHLAHHWPSVPVFPDVLGLGAESLAGVGNVEVICGGFPCQDISEAGKRVGIDGARSGLWGQMLRLVRELRPRWVVAENVPALKYRGYDRVATDLEAAGYAVRPLVVGALHVGASQGRQRVWILANANDAGLQGPVGPRQPAAPREERAPACSEPLRSACGFWPPGPGAVLHIPRMDDGPTDRIHRLRALGNTIVPQIPEIIGRAILEAEKGFAQ